VSRSRTAKPTGLTYALRTASGWSEGSIVGDPIDQVAIVLDSTDRPHASFSDRADGWVKYAREAQ
jgi:hypothetical protein